MAVTFWTNCTRAKSLASMKVLIMMLERLQRADLFEGFGDDEGIEAEGVFVDAAVGEREGGGLAVGDHDDLLHVLALAGEDALGDAQAFAGVGVVGTDLDARELRDGDLFGGVVEEDEREGVAGDTGCG